MYTGILHTHKTVVILFLVLYVVKTALLLANQKELLEKVKKITKVPEMIISTAFLGTGLYLLVLGVSTTSIFQWIKFGAVFASIPLAVIGFKRNNKFLATLSLLLIIAAYGLAEVNKARRVEKQMIAENIITDQTKDNYDVVTHGKAVFNAYCIGCHGEDGKLGLNGSKDLSISTLVESDIRQIILNGKNAMSPYKKVLTEKEVDAVLEYVKTLRK
jgi:cytochrome c5